MVSTLTVKIGADIDGLQRQLNNASGQLQGFGKSMKAVGGMIAGAFAADKIIQFGQEVFKVTAEFQKFEAVLTNTLGHKGAAQAALSQITDFAAKTPFQVNELTDSFVKLANQGFVPTINQMRSLGDLAASQGKSFNQLTEAIIDAQTGEFERLKEFGIRASKEGDKVTFTFKGVKQQVDFTADSIRKYVLSLGDVEGVTGGMEAQSKTLGGGLSNLKDNWEQLTLAIGKSMEKGGMFSGVMDAIASSVRGLTDIISPASVEENARALKELIKVRQDAARSGDIEEWARLNNMIQQGTESVREWWEGQKKLADLQNTQVNPALKEQAVALQRIKGLLDSPSFADNDKKRGLDFLAETGVLGNSLKGLDVQVRQSMSNISTSMIKSRDEITLWGESARIQADLVAQKFIDIAPMLRSAISSGIGTIASALGEALVGVGNFGDKMLAAIGAFAEQFGSALIAAGTAAVVAQQALFTNPYAAIAAGVALVAIGAALSASASKAQSNLSKGGGGGGGSGASSGPSNMGNLGSGGLEIAVGGEFTIKGDDLVYIINRRNQLNGRTRG